MNSLILGGYSGISDANDARRLEVFADSCLAPLLQYLYKNAHFEFTLYVTSEEMLWIEANRSAIQKLIARLVKRKSLSLLISSKNHCFMPISSAQNVTDQIEQMRMQVRKHYRNRCKGYFAFGGFWSSELISKLAKADISYAVVPTFVKNRFDSGPFFMSEHGKKFVIYPSDYAIADAVSRFAAGKIGSDDFRLAVEEYASGLDRDRCVSCFLNFDDLVDAGKDTLFCLDSIFGIFRNRGFRFFNTDDDIAFKRIGYLNSGSYYYGEDYISELFKGNDSFNRIAMINYISSLSVDKMIHKKDREALKSHAVLMSYGDQFVKNDDASGKYNEMLSELFVGINSGSIRIPDMYRLESLELVVIRKKEYLAFLDTAQGCIRKIFSMRTANEICFGAPSFYDIVEDSRNGRSIAKYGSYCLDGISDDIITLAYQNGSLDYSIRKSFVFSANSIICNIALANIAQKPVSFSFAQFFCLKNGNGQSAPLSSAQPTGFLEMEALSESQSNECLFGLDPKKTYMPYYDLNMVTDEVLDFNYSISIMDSSQKEKRALTKAKECQ